MGDTTTRREREGTRIWFSLPDEQRFRLEEIAKSRGYGKMSTFVRVLVLEAIEKVAPLV